MIRILLNGAMGKMGRMVTEMVAAESNMEIVAGVDRFAAGASASFPLSESLDGVKATADVLIDFSGPDALHDILAYCRTREMAVVLATTGYSPEDLTAIAEAAEGMRVFRSANMSIGINLMMDLTRDAAVALKGFDIEIIEMHHNTKADSPSGTALMLADGINKELMNTKRYLFGRHTKTERRKSDEIGIHAIRGGSITGEHRVMYIGQDEQITLTHSASSRRIYAVGALRAAEFLMRSDVGLYNMQDLLLEQASVTSLLIDKEQAMFTAWDVPAQPKVVAGIFSQLGGAGVLVDMISQTSPRNGMLDVSFTLPRGDAAKARDVLAERNPEINGAVTKLTIEGPGMERQSGVAARVLDQLAGADVGILMITTSETKISLLIDEAREATAIQALRAAFRFD